MRAHLALLSAAVVLYLASASARSSGQQGGFGGGGFGGGGAIRQTDLFTTTNVLTPGEADPWPVSAVAGETLIIGVRSSAFDPTVSVIGPDGKTVGENDDVKPGLQDSLLLVRLPRAGSYKVTVKSLKSRAGGQYTLTIRRFVATPTEVGARVSRRFEKGRVAWHRLKVERGRTLAVTVSGADLALSLYKPTGDLIDDPVPFKQTPTRHRALLVADATGDHYIRVAGDEDSDAGYALVTSLARETALAVGQEAQPRPLEEAGLDIVRFAGRKGQLVSLSLSGPAGLEIIPTHGPNAESTSAPWDDAALTALPDDPKSAGTQVLLLRREGDFRVLISHETGAAARYVLRIADAARQWPAAGPAVGEVHLGESHYWRLDAEPGKILRLEAASTQFDVEVELYDPSGEKIGANDDGGQGRNARLTVLAGTGGAFLVRVHAHGDGGSGAYTLTRAADVVRPIAVGGSANGELGVGGSEIYSFAARAGQTLLVVVRSVECALDATVYGPDGLRVEAGSRSAPSNDAVFPIVCPLDGSYTLWVEARDAGGQYTLRLLDVP